VVVSGLLMGAVYALFSSGLTLIWGMMNVVNFAHGDFVMLAMYAAFFAFTLLHLGPVWFVPIAAVLLFALGVIVYLGLVRHVARACCGGDVTRVRSVEAQFRRPVWPGDTLVTEGWVVRPDAIALRVRVKERDEAVITGAWALLA